MQSEKLGQYLLLNESIIRCKRPRRRTRGIFAYWHYIAIAAGIVMIIMAYKGH
jgi:hypothetical protein